MVYAGFSAVTAVLVWRPSFGFGREDFYVLQL